ncbi:MAG: hypothetical protein F6J86_06665 [Symploca sp. SIO1B1]|nr:hypothetical protein [Symploca sp. SIO1B1]
MIYHYSYHSFTMNDTHSPSFRKPEEKELPLSSSQADNFRNLLQHLPPQKKPSKKRRKDTTLEGLVEQFYPQLEEARTQRNYTYEQLAELFKTHLERPIAKDTLRKYMSRLKKRNSTSITTLHEPTKIHTNYAPVSKTRQQEAKERPPIQLPKNLR